jgi:hypothetical protein
MNNCGKVPFRLASHYSLKKTRPTKLFMLVPEFWGAFPTICDVNVRKPELLQISWSSNKIPEPFYGFPKQNTVPGTSILKLSLLLFTLRTVALDVIHMDRMYWIPTVASRLHDRIRSLPHVQVQIDLSLYAYSQHPIPNSQLPTPKLPSVSV